MFWWVNLKQINNLESLEVDGRIILIDFSEIRIDSLDWVHLTRERDSFQAVVPTVMNVEVT